jgi:hypothetical protein
VPRPPLAPAERLRRTQAAIDDLVRRIKRAITRRERVDHLLPMLRRYEAEAQRLQTSLAETPA